MKKALFSLALLISLTGHMSDAVFNNAGTMCSWSPNISADIFNNTGTIEGLDNVYLECDKLTGNGLIKGPQMGIVAIECEYEGVINCSGRCVLITNTPDSELKFTFEGGGELVIKRVGS